jgi:hypothetical protein
LGEPRFEVRAVVGSLGFINAQYSVWDAQRKCLVMECRSKEEAEEFARGFNAAWSKRQEAERQAVVRAAFEEYMAGI